MPDCVHLLIRKHRNLAEKMIETLQLGSLKEVDEPYSIQRR